jgi:hypothetical protein
MDWKQRTWIPTKKITVSSWALALAATVICPVLAKASAGEKAIVHCTSSCKVYVDETQVASLPQGGVKAIYLESGKEQTVLITRPGKADWVHSITPRGPLSLNPDEKGPKLLGSGVDADSAPPARSDSKERANEAASTVPNWLRGDWWYELDDKKVSLKKGSNTCPFVANSTLKLEEEDDHRFAIAFDQDLAGDRGAMDSMSESTIIQCYGDDIENASGQKWNFTYYISIETKSDSEVAFRAEMETCLGGGDCKIPSTGGQITGTITRLDDGGLKLTLKGPLPGDFVLRHLRD